MKKMGIADTRFAIYDIGAEVTRTGLSTGIFHLLIAIESTLLSKNRIGKKNIVLVYRGARMNIHPTSLVFCSQR